MKFERQKKNLSQVGRLFILASRTFSVPSILEILVINHNLAFASQVIALTTDALASINMNRLHHTPVPLVHKRIEIFAKSAKRH